LGRGSAGSGTTVGLLLIFAGLVAAAVTSKRRARKVVAPDNLEQADLGDTSVDADLPEPVDPDPAQIQATAAALNARTDLDLQTDLDLGADPDLQVDRDIETDAYANAGLAVGLAPPIEMELADEPELPVESDQSVDSGQNVESDADGEPHLDADAEYDTHSEIGADAGSLTVLEPPALALDDDPELGSDELSLPEAELQPAEETGLADLDQSGPITAADFERIFASVGNDEEGAPEQEPLLDLLPQEEIAPSTQSEANPSEANSTAEPTEDVDPFRWPTEDDPHPGPAPTPQQPAAGNTPPQNLDAPESFDLGELADQAPATDAPTHPAAETTTFDLGSLPSPPSTGNSFPGITDFAAEQVPVRSTPSPIHPFDDGIDDSPGPASQPNDSDNQDSTAHPLNFSPDTSQPNIEADPGPWADLPPAPETKSSSLIVPTDDDESIAAKAAKTARIDPSELATRPRPAPPVRPQNRQPQPNPTSSATMEAATAAAADAAAVEATAANDAAGAGELAELDSAVNHTGDGTNHTSDGSTDTDTGTHADTDDDNAATAKRVKKSATRPFAAKRLAEDLIDGPDPGAPLAVAATASAADNNEIKGPIAAKRTKPKLGANQNTDPSDDLPKEGGVFYGWVLVGAVFAILAITSGIGFYNASVILAAATRELNASVGSISGATGLFFAISGLTGYAFSKQMDTVDLRWFFAVGGMVGAIALVGLQWVTSVVHLYIFFAVFGVGFALAGLVPGTTLVTRWFDRRRSVALSVASTGLSFGGFAVTPISAWFIDNRGLAGASPYLAAIWIVGIVPVALLLIRSFPAEKGLLPDGATAPTADDTAPAALPATALSAGATADATALPVTAGAATDVDASSVDGMEFGTARVSRFFIALCVAYAVIFFGQVGAIAQLYNMVQERTDVSAASASIMVLAMTSVVARLIGGVVVTKISTQTFTASLAALQAAALVALALSPSVITLLLSAAFFGASVGNLLMLQPLLLAEAFGVRNYSRIYGFNQLFGTLGVAGGPLGLGLLRDSYDYEVAFIVAAGASFVGFLFIILAGPMSQVRDRWGTPQPSDQLELGLS
jgi:MFS family permease